MSLTVGVTCFGPGFNSTSPASEIRAAIHMRGSCGWPPQKTGDGPPFGGRIVVAICGEIRQHPHERVRCDAGDHHHHHHHHGAYSPCFPVSWAGIHRTLAFYLCRNNKNLLPAVEKLISSGFLETNLIPSPACTCRQGWPTLWLDAMFNAHRHDPQSAAVAARAQSSLLLPPR